MTEAFYKIIDLVQKNMKRHQTKFVNEGHYVAEVDIELIDSNDGWSPYLSLEDTLKLDEVREALKKRDIAAANKLGRVYEMSRVKVA